MTRALPRAPIHSSRLVRFLTENALFGAAQSSEGVGQKLGDWLDFRQAIALHAVLHPEQPIEVAAWSTPRRSVRRPVRAGSRPTRATTSNPAARRVAKPGRFWDAMVTR